VNVRSETHVVGQVPSIVIGIFIDHHLVAVPQPVGAEADVHRGNAEVKTIEPEPAGTAAGQPPPVTFAKSAGEAPSLALDSSYLYWAESPLTENQMSLVNRIPLGGGAVEPVLAVRGSIRQIFVDPPFLYSVDERSVRALQLLDGSQTTLGPSAQAGAMTVDQGTAYWLGASAASPPAIMSASGPGFPRVSLAMRDAAIPAMRAAGQSLYWVERGGWNDGASLFTMDRAGGTPVRLFESSRMSASAAYGHALLAADTDGVYWMVDPSGPTSDGALYQGARGLEPRILVSGIGRPGGVAASAGQLVFTDMGAGFVVRVSK
jgi:hypothetical protein